MHIAIVVYDGFDDLDAIGPFEVFSHAKHCGADLAVGLYTHAPQEIVESHNGLRIEPDGTLPPDPELVIVPGGAWGTLTADGAGGEADQDTLPGALTRLHQDGTTVASVCTGGMLLAHAGLTDGRPAITHHDAVDGLRASGAEVVDARVVNDGDLVTAGGVTAGLDLALHLVERDCGADLAERVATLMEYERRGEVVHA